jgi:hypothetical protein
LSDEDHLAEESVQSQDALSVGRDENQMSLVDVAQLTHTTRVKVVGRLRFLHRYGAVLRIDLLAGPEMLLVI